MRGYQEGAGIVEVGSAVLKAAREGRWGKKEETGMEQRREIPEAAERLEKAVARLGTAVATILSRLRPVIAVRPPRNAVEPRTPSDPDWIVESELGIAICTAAHRVNEVAKQLEEAAEDLAL